MKNHFKHVLIALGVVFTFTYCDNNITDSGSSSNPPSTPPPPASAEAELVSPVPDASGQTTDLDFTWRKGSADAQYNLQVAESEEFAPLTIDTTLTGTSFTANSLSEETTYYWRLRSETGEEAGTWSEIRKFETGSGESEPVTLELISPDSETEATEGELSFEWEELDEPASYHFQLSLNSDFSDLAADSVLEVSFFDMNDLKSGNYHWRVAPVLGSATGTWSEARSFQMISGSDGDGDDSGDGDGTGGGDQDAGGPQIPSIGLLAPSNGSTGLPLDFTFEWEETELAADYTLQVSTDDTFSNIVLEEIANGGVFDATGLDHGQSYYWRVQPSNGDWSDAYQFETDVQATDPPASGDFVQAVNGDFVVGDRTFRFAGTNAYHLPNYEKLDVNVVNRALDGFEEAGVNVVRMWGFYDGYDCGYSRNDRNENVIQTSPGQYSESALRDLDRVIAKGKEKGIRFILPFINYWSELGGLCQYNTWAGASNPDRNMSFFIENSQTQKWFRDYIEMLLNRVNTVTGVAYKDEPAIFAWEIMNEGRNQGADPRIIRDWYQEIAQFIKSIDSNHMVATGEDGFDEGTPSEYSLNEYSNTYVLRAGEGTSYVMNTAIPEIDFGGAHWYANDFGFSGMSVMKRAQKAWVKDHADIAADLGKPFVLGEYGHPGFGNGEQLEVYEDLWNFAEEIDLDGSLIWQLTADGTKCYEFGGNICYPGGRNDTALYNSFQRHISTMNNSSR